VVAKFHPQRAQRADHADDSANVHAQHVHVSPLVPSDGIVALPIFPRGSPLVPNGHGRSRNPTGFPTHEHAYERPHPGRCS
jgi:hypothetical protein